CASCRAELQPHPSAFPKTLSDFAPGIAARQPEILQQMVAHLSECPTLAIAVHPEMEHVAGTQDRAGERSGEPNRRRVPAPQEIGRRHLLRAHHRLAVMGSITLRTSVMRLAGK